MTRASGQIEQTLGQLREKTTEIAEEFEDLYQSYLEALGKAAKRQLILATYHLCTRIYPQPFLALSQRQRERVQKQLRQLANQIGEKLLAKWTSTEKLSRRPLQEDGLALIKQLFLQAEIETAKLSEEVRQDTEDTSVQRYKDTPLARKFKAQLLENPLILTDALEVQSSDTAADGPGDAEEATAETADPDESLPPLEPIHLLRQQLLMEKGIRDILRAVSEAANQQLQRASILPEIPKPLLAAAAESDGLSQTPIKTPNLLKISIKLFSESDEEDEDEDDEDEEPEKLSKGQRYPKFVSIEPLPEFIVVGLRLSEIEFADATTAHWRGRIREKMAQLKQLGLRYQKTQREFAIAQAEDAWRAGWFEE